jgi:hypothetical protein
MCNLRDLHHFQRLLWAREAVVFLVEESGVHSPEDAQRMVQAVRDGCPAGGVDALIEGTELMAGREKLGEINRLGCLACILTFALMNGWHFDMRLLLSKSQNHFSTYRAPPLAKKWSEPLRVDNELSNSNSWRESHEKDQTALRPGIQNISSSRA